MAQRTPPLPIKSTTRAGAGAGAASLIVGVGETCSQLELVCPHTVGTGSAKLSAGAGEMHSSIGVAATKFEVVGART